MSLRRIVEWGATVSGGEDRHRVLGAMRSGEWLPARWIARVAFNLGGRRWAPADAGRVLAVLGELHATGYVETRHDMVRRKRWIRGTAIVFQVPRCEWRITNLGRWAARGRLEQISDETFEWFALTWLEIQLLPGTPRSPLGRLDLDGSSPIIRRDGKEGDAG
jgi:hypothetical protein